MTRKDELAARARDYVSLFVMSGAEPAATKNLTWMLEQVDQEVWEKAATYADRLPVESAEKRRVTATIADWCRAQQQELR